MNQKQSETILREALKTAVETKLIRPGLAKTILKNIERVKANQEFLKTLEGNGRSKNN